MIEFLRRLPEWKAFRVFVVLFFAIVAGFLLWQGITSAYRFYPGLPGYKVQAFDSTPRWAGTRALFLQGVNPYSPQGDAVIQTQYFGRPLQPGDKSYTGDQQKFAYPLHVVFLYLPTIFSDFSTALIILLISFYVSFVVSIVCWFHRLDFPASTSGKLFVLTLCLALPEMYIAFQSRQPALWVFFFVSACIYLMMRGDPRSDALAGFVLAWSTIKPQNSVLVILYVVFVVYLFSRGLRKSIWFLTGFIGTGLVLLGLTWVILPGWVLDFLNAARDYRNYAGSTGAESVFGVNSVGAIGVSLVGILIWLGMIWYVLKHPSFKDGHYLALAYALALQVLIFPSHLYNFVFVLPLVLVALKWVWSKTNVGVDVLTPGVLGLLLLTVYFAYLYWFGILSEGFGGTIAGIFSTIRFFLPGGVYYFTVSAMFLGPLLFWAQAREPSVGKLP